MGEVFTSLCGKKNDRLGEPYDYYAVHFADAGRQRYRLIGFNGCDVHVERLALSASDDVQTEKLPVSRILGMESEIVHYKKNMAKSYRNLYFITPLTIICISSIAKFFFSKGRGLLFPHSSGSVNSKVRNVYFYCV